jgi:hypothetical protein
VCIITTGEEDVSIYLSKTGEDLFENCILVYFLYLLLLHGKYIVLESVSDE